MLQLIILILHLLLYFVVDYLIPYHINLSYFVMDSKMKLFDFQDLLFYFVTNYFHLIIILISSIIYHLIRNNIDFLKLFSFITLKSHSYFHAFYFFIILSFFNILHSLFNILISIF